ncbi:UbiX family flavin prenyltransferase [Pseudorhodobacter ferrugineus]|uniref:UbiX family flavin prenyltransferase n=1 Tax=Pseudorhodobacter ferrugineus TaxID=77008 RepID=UPI0003B51B20|nr:UbiX family flavin prenyltransferase [Pseudorhodobacter ferrugineus]
MMGRVILAVSGASGAELALEVAKVLRRTSVAVDLVLSSMAERTLVLEIGPEAHGELVSLVDCLHPISDLGATLGSGSYPVAGMIVAPCSMRSLAAIAQGLDDNLLTRAASVQLKERRPLVLLAREAPLTLAHLRNMTAVTEMGGIIMPPVPAFYLLPKTIEDITTQIAARAVDLLRLAPPQAKPWAPPNGE